MNSTTTVKNGGIKWFDRLSHEIFTIYKKSILEYPLDEYRYIQLNWTGSKFALGLSTNPRDGYYEYLKNGDWFDKGNNYLENEFRILENIPYEKYDDVDKTLYEVEFKRKKWPKDSDECYVLQCFLINISMSLVYIKLEKDKEVENYLKKIEVIKVVSSGYDLEPYIKYYSKLSSYPVRIERENVIDKLLSSNREKKVVLDLMQEKIISNKSLFLNYFKRQVTKIEDMPKLSLQEAYEQAYDLELRSRNEEAIEVLKSVLEKAIKDNNVHDFEMIEKCCDVMGRAHIDITKSIYWFKKGLEYVPNGHSALSLMSYYELDLDDYDALVNFCEKHLKSIDLEDDVDHTTQCYRYLGRGYLRLINKDKVISTYRAIYDFLTNRELYWRLDNIIKDLEKFEKRCKRMKKYSDSKKFDYEHVSGILSWFKYQS